MAYHFSKLNRRSGSRRRIQEILALVRSGPSTVLLPLILLALLPVPALSAAEPAPGNRTSAVIPEDRRIAWNPGIPSGIPQYPVFAAAARYLAL